MALFSDLSVQKIADNLTPKVGDNVTFTITAINNGPDSDTSVVVTDSVPSGFTIISATPSSGAWVFPTWTIGNLNLASSATLTIVAKVLATGTYSNTATITGANNDPNPNNNTSTAIISPLPLGNCQAEIINSVNFGLGNPPGTIQYFIGSSPITSALSISNASTITSIQNSIDTDPTYIASGTIITVLTGLPSVTVTIKKTSTSQISDLANGTFIGASFNSTDSEPFVCSLSPVTPKKKRRVGFWAQPPQVQCFKRQRDINGNLIPCQDRLLLFGGANYALDKNNSDDKKCCYRKTNPPA